MNRQLIIKKKQEKGQGLVEYALILVLVSIVVIAGMTVLGPTIGNVFSDINNGLAGGGACSSAATAYNHYAEDSWAEDHAERWYAYQAALESAGGYSACKEYFDSIGLD